jgi:starch synthase
MAQRYSRQLAARIMFDETLARRIYAGSDIFLMPSLSEPCGLGQLLALRYGSIPVVRETGGLKDTVTAYNEYTGTGNGFTFTHFNARDFLYTIDRALNFYGQKDVWFRLVNNACKGNFSWQRSAREYLDLYRKLLSGFFTHDA